MAKTAGSDVNSPLPSQGQHEQEPAENGDTADKSTSLFSTPIRRDFVVPRAERDSSQELESDEAAQAHVQEVALSYTSSPQTIPNGSEPLRPQHSRSRTSPSRKSSSPKSASSSVSSYLLDEAQVSSESSDGGSSPVVHTIPGNRSSTGNLYKKPYPTSILQATRPGYKRQRTNSHPTFLLRTTTAPSGSRSPSRTATPISKSPIKRVSHATRSHSASMPNGRIRSDSKPPSPFAPDLHASPSALPRFTNGLQHSPEDENGPLEAQASSSSETFSPPKPRKRRKSPDRALQEQDHVEHVEPGAESTSSEHRQPSPRRKRAVRKSVSERPQAEAPIETDNAALRDLLAQVDITSALELVKSVQKQNEEQTHIPRPSSMRFPKSEEVLEKDFEHEPKRERRFSIHRSRAKSVTKDAVGVSRSHSVAGFLGLGKGKGKEKEEEAKTGELRAFEESIHRVYLTLSPATVTRADNARASLEERYAPVYHALEEHEEIPSLLNVARWRQRRTSSERSMRRMSMDQSSSRSGEHGLFTKAAILNRSGSVHSNQYNSDASSMQSFPTQHDSTRALLKKSSNRSAGQAWNIQPQELTEFLDADDKEDEDASSIKERAIDNPSILMPAAHIQPQMKRSGSLRSVASRSSAAKSTGTSPPSSRLKTSPQKHFNSSPKHKLNSSVSPGPLEPTPESPDPEDPNHTITNRGRKRMVSTPAHSDTESHTPRFAPHTRKRRESTSTQEVWSPETSDAEGPKRRNSQLHGSKFASRLRSSPKTTFDDADSTKGTDHEDNHRRSGFGAALASLTSMHDSASGRRQHHHHLHHSKNDGQSSLRNSQLAEAEKAPDPFADQLPWSAILGLDISGPVFPERSRPAYTAEDQDVEDLHEQDELVTAMSDFLHRVDKRIPEAPTKIRRYLDQLQNHSVNTKILSRSTVECQLEQPQLDHRIKEEVESLPHAIDVATFQEHEQIHSEEEELDHHSDDQVAASKLPKGAQRHSKSASLDSSALLNKQIGEPIARRHTLASTHAPKDQADQSLVDPLPGLEHIVTDFENACNEGKSRLFDHHAVQADLKERILDLREEANSIQEYNDQTIEQTLGSLEEMLLKVRPVTNNKSRSMDFLWSLCAAALSSVFWIIRLLASIISTFTSHPIISFFLVIGATLYAFTDITL